MEGKYHEDSHSNLIIGRKLEKNLEIVKNTDSTNCGSKSNLFYNIEKYPTYVEYVPNKKRNSAVNPVERKAYSNPDSSNSIQAIQRAIRLNKNPLSVENRKVSSNQKGNLKHLTEVNWSV